MNVELSGKAALVTGAARGIGAGIAKCLAEHGCTVYVADIDEDGARAFVASLGRGSIDIRLDVQDEAAVKAAVTSIAQQHGGLDILVNNAGLVCTGPSDRISRQEWDRLIGVNLTGVFNCVQAAIPAMAGRRGASIVNLASVSAEKGGGAFGNTWYGATKAAVVAITKGLARELGPRGVRVNAISPGIIETAMIGHLLTREVRERLMPRCPIGRFGSPQDIANAALFLVSDAASFVTGETIAVDGGFLRT